MLKEHTSDVTVVVDGLQAFREFQKREFDMLIMDVQMPVMGDREKCLEAGMDACLSKPLNKEQLDRAIRICRHDSVSNEARG
ncbi:hypothetical protein BDV34DRAFT_222991 [Aspergillus parasiticus]|uniref:Response regulatory domain-containing protein n=1 Tax=Aspergillus parasiticus TaxID=5067 RepID=A0A5N6DSK7_ASPPA|nr:hypothetical protein BDV34DRAFT_222991 [Aspergillus parasiticus]